MQDRHRLGSLKSRRHRVSDVSKHYAHFVLTHEVRDAQFDERMRSLFKALSGRLPVSAFPVLLEEFTRAIHAHLVEVSQAQPEVHVSYLDRHQHLRRTTVKPMLLPPEQLLACIRAEVVEQARPLAQAGLPVEMARDHAVIGEIIAHLAQCAVAACLNLVPDSAPTVMHLKHFVVLPYPFGLSDRQDRDCAVRAFRKARFNHLKSHVLRRLTSQPFIDAYRWAVDFVVRLHYQRPGSAAARRKAGDQAVRGVMQLALRNCGTQPFCLPALEDGCEPEVSGLRSCPIKLTPALSKLQREIQEAAFLRMAQQGLFVGHRAVAEYLLTEFSGLSTPVALALRAQGLAPLGADLSRLFVPRRSAWESLNRPMQAGSMQSIDLGTLLNPYLRRPGAASLDADDDPAA